MKLHENRELFTEAITAAALPKEEGGLSVPSSWRKTIGFVTHYLCWRTLLLRNMLFSREEPA